MRLASFSTITLWLVFVCERLAALPARQRWHWLLGIAIVFSLLAVISSAIGFLGFVRERRAARELLLMQRRFPFCNVSRLSSGAWFLTDRATGREYQPPPGLPQPRV